MLREINHSHIALIPKVPSPSSTGNYRPISMCNVLYNIISKILGKGSSESSLPAYPYPKMPLVLGRLISDGSLLANELFNHISHHKKGKIHLAALKLDMSKAFDRVSWVLSYLHPQENGLLWKIDSVSFPMFLHNLFLTSYKWIPDLKIPSI